MNIGERIRKYRKAIGYTQKELAEKSGVATVSVQQYERGIRQPRLEQLRRIASALGVEWTELVPENQQGQTVVDHMTELIKNTASSGKVSVHKMTDTELFRAGILQFHSEADRIVHFYKKLTDEGKIVAGGYFFRNLDKDTLSKVADYVMSLSENPLYQRPAAPQDTPAPQEGTDTAPAPDAPETPPEGE